MRRQAQANCHIRFPHGEVELLIRSDQRQVDVGIKLNEFSQPRREPMHPDARRRGHAQIAVRSLATVGELCACRFELHEHVVRGVMKKLALLRENEPAGMAVKQRDAELLLQCRDLARHRRLRQAKLLAGMGEAAGFGGGVENLELVPIHAGLWFHSTAHSAATAGSASPCAARKRSASSAAMHP